MLTYIKFFLGVLGCVLILPFFCNKGLEQVFVWIELEEVCSAGSLIASARIRSLDEGTNKTEEIAQVTKGINAIIGNRFVILLMLFLFWLINMPVL